MDQQIDEQKCSGEQSNIDQIETEHSEIEKQSDHDITTESDSVVLSTDLSTMATSQAQASNEEMSKNDQIDDLDEIKSSINVSFKSNLEENPDVNRDENRGESRDKNQYDNQDDQSSTSSSHPPVDQVFKPNYAITIMSGELEVDDISIYYVIKANKIDNTADSTRAEGQSHATSKKDCSQEAIVKREHDDFLYLNHVLVNSAYPGYGLIVPPLISKPNLDDVYLSTQEELFSRNAELTNLLFDEQWQKECWFLEKYLNAMLEHPTFGKDAFWQRFLMTNEPPPKIKLKKNTNLLSSLFTSGDQDSLFSASKPNRLHRDCDDWFQRERDWLHYYQFLLKEALDIFNSRLQARTKLCNTLEHLSTTLTLNFATDEGVYSRFLSKLNNTFSKSLIESANSMQIMSLNDETTISCNFEYFEKYMRNAKEMMNNRVCLLIDYENANRNLERAKTGSKRQAAEKLKYESEKIFEDCSEIARIEMKRLHQEMNKKMTESIENYAKWQLIGNQEILKVIKTSIQMLKKL